MKKTQTAIGIAGGIVGLAAYLYLLGGLVTWLRFIAARLPADDTVRALDSNRLLAVGVKAFLFELVLIGILLGLTWALWTWQVSDSESVAEKAREGLIAWILVLQGVVAGVLAGALSVSAWDVSRPDSIAVGLIVGGLWLMLSPFALEKLQKRPKLKKYLKTALTIPAIGLAIFVLGAPPGVAVLVLLLIMHLSHLLTRLPTKRDPARLIPSVLVLATGLSLVVGAYLATPPVALNDAVVVLDSDATIEGGYVGQSGEGFFLATCEPDRENPKVSRGSRLTVISPDRIKKVVFNGRRYALDHGKDPSLLDLGLYFLHRDEIEEQFRTASVDFRESKLVCGLRHFLELTGRTRSAGHRVKQQVRVRGAGRLVLFGRDIAQEAVKVKRASEVSLPVALGRATKRTRRCTGPFETTIRVQFRLEDGDLEERRATVTLPTAGPAGKKGGCRLSGATEAKPPSGLNAR